METKGNLKRDKIKKQEFFIPEGYTRPGVELEESDEGSVIPVNTSSNAQKTGGASTIQDFDYKKYAEVERKATDSRTNAIAGLILGILSLITAWFSGITGLALGIAGIVFSVMGRKERGGEDMAIAGLICSVIGIVVAVVSMMLVIFVVGSVFGGGIYI